MDLGSGSGWVCELVMCGECVVGCADCLPRGGRVSYIPAYHPVTDVLTKYRGAAVEVTDAVRKKAGLCRNARTIE